MATVFMSVATRLSDLDDQKSGINIQTEDHTLTPSNSWNGPEDPEVFGSTPSHSPSWSLARKLTPDWPETQYCLEIQVTSTEDWGATPPPPHMWQAPIMEEMVWDGKSGLTEVVVTSPGKAILFYRQQLLEGLSLGEAWDAMFTLSGAISWVHKQAQLSAKSVSLGDGQQLIAQTITKGHIKPRGPGHPHSILPVSTPFNFHNQAHLYNQKTPQQLLNTGRCPDLATDQYTSNKVGHHSKLRSRPGAVGVMGGLTPVTITVISLWIQNWQKFSINFLISVVNVWEIGRL